MSFSITSTNLLLQPNFYPFCPDKAYQSSTKEQPTNALKLNFNAQNFYPELLKKSSPCFETIIQKLENPKNFFLTEKEIDCFIEQISKEDFENASEEEISKIVNLLVQYAREGVEDPHGKKLLEKDILELFDGKDSFLEPRLRSPLRQSPENLLSKKEKKKGFFKKNCKKIGNFIKKHKKAIIITTVVIASVAVAAVAAVAVINTVGMAALAETAAATGGAAIGTVGASQLAKDGAKEDEKAPELCSQPFNNFDPPKYNASEGFQDIPTSLQAENIPQTIQAPTRDAPPIEKERNIFPIHPIPTLSEAIPPVSKDTFEERIQAITEEAGLVPNPYISENQQNLPLDVYENRIKRLEKELNVQFISHQDKVEHATTYIKTPNLQFPEAPQPTASELTIDFCIGYAKGIKEGAIDSGTSLKHLAAELVKHPLDTMDQVVSAFKDLSDLALTDQWSEFSQMLSPEACKLATEWTNLSAEERGSLAGYTIGKLGTDIFIPGAAAKLASRGVKGANKLLNISNSLQKAENALALEGVVIEGETQLINKPNPINLAGESILPKIIFGEGSFTIEKLLEAGKAIDREGLTKAGRGLAKHGGREPTVFPKPTGNPAEINLQGQQMLEQILNHPNKKLFFNPSPRFGDIIDIEVADIGGVRYDSSGKFIGFLQPK